ncbi:hypothetical protein NLM27_42420 [Bradyrhizobium sp. CCGB12]|uniref:hypothetical protein n=1 Tax=Bradyrhizobium sp. CCGB12 TaxID=2949632 RepID=UPI0020B39FE2|nr:hypothetical protein [Bradyrhizobium sp. CCGB12]MCP3395379.1 hypothetical protein [Bradyrhizobium sp. CCGB12]
MGIERTFTPRYFRNKAEEFRTKADNCEHSESKQSLRNVAKSYDELARRAEQVRTSKMLQNNLDRNGAVVERT